MVSETLLAGNRTPRHFDIQRISFIASVSLLFAVGLTFCIIQYYWIRRGYIWVDEAFTLTATDPRISPFAMQSSILAKETNPPLHFWLLNLLRHVISEPRTAGYVVNGIGLILVCSFMVWCCAQMNKLRFGVVLTSVYLLSAATILLWQDIRPGGIAGGLCAAVAILALKVRKTDTASQTDLWLGAGIGVLAGISHVYGALFAGSVAAAMTVYGLARRQAAITCFGLVLGGSCSAAFGLWWASLYHATKGNLQSIAWLKDPSINEHTLMMVWPPFFGPDYAWVLVLVGVALAAWSVAFWRSAWVWLVAAGLFVILPQLVSLRQPIILWRYFIIAAPAFHVLLAGIVYDMLTALPNWQSRRPNFSTIGAAVALTVVALSGPFVSRQLALDRPVWSGIDIIRKNATDCTAKTVRSAFSPDTFSDDIYQFGYDYALRGTGLKAQNAALHPMDVADVHCRVVGWMEHSILRGILAGIVPGAPTEDEALKALNLTNKAHVPLTIERHYFGFVILKADKAGDQGRP